MKTPEEISALLAKAQEHLDKSEYALAEGLAEEVLALKDGKGGLTIEDEARSHCYLGYCCYNTARYHEALNHIGKSLNLAESVSNLSIQAAALAYRGWIEQLRGDTDAALETAKRSLSLAEKANDNRSLRHALDSLGNVHLALGNYSPALDSFTRCLALQDALSHDPGVASTLRGIGAVHFKRGDYPLALKAFSRALEISEANSMNVVVAGTLSNIGAVYFYTSDYANALEYFSRALPIAESVGHTQFVHNILGNIGSVYLYLGDYPLALDYFNRVCQEAERVGNAELLSSNIGSIGIVYRDIADYPRALEYFGRALAINEKLGKKSSMTVWLGNIGVVLNDLGDFTRSLEYQTRALAIAEEIGDKRLVAQNARGVGQIHSELSEFPQAQEFLNRALEVSEQIGDRRMVGLCRDNLAAVQRGLGNLDAAYSELMESVRIERDELKSEGSLASAIFQLGSLLIEMGRHEEGLAQLNEAILLAETLGQKKVASDAHKEVADALARQGDKAAAYDHFQQHYTLKEEIFSEESRKKIEAFNFRVAIAKEEQEKELAKRDAEVNRLKAEKAEDSLRLKERDLANTASSLAAQTELLGNFRTDLRKIVLRPDRYDAEDIIKQVRAKLKELPCEMIDFSKFEGQFATVHPEFRAKLETKYPDLTPQEVKMCMLIHVNLKTPAVARLMCLSERTVDNHRFNIRKKMLLKTEDNLAEHLRKIDGRGKDER